MNQDELDTEAHALATLALQGTRKHGYRFAIVLVFRNPDGSAESAIASNMTDPQLRVIGTELATGKGHPTTFVSVPKSGES